MQSRTGNRYSKGRNCGGKDSFWGLAMLAVLVVTTVSFGVSLYVDSQTAFLSGGVADESGAVAVAQAAGLVGASH